MRILAGIAGVCFVFAAGLCCMVALATSAQAETIMHQLLGALYWLIAAVLAVGGMILICNETGSAKPTSSTAEDKELRIIRVKLGDAMERFEELAADVAWFKEQEVKKITRAKAAVEASKKA